MFYFIRNGKELHNKPNSHTLHAIPRPLGVMFADLGVQYTAAAIERQKNDDDRSARSTSAISRALASAGLCVFHLELAINCRVQP